MPLPNRETADDAARDVGSERAVDGDGPAYAASVSAAGAELDSILDTLDMPVVVLTRDCTIARINQAAIAALGLTPADIGRSVCDIRLLKDVDNLEKLCATVMANGAPYRREIRDGNRWFVVRVAPSIRGDRAIIGGVLTFTNVTAFRVSIDQAIYEREYTKAILNTVAQPLVVLDANLRLQTANRAFYSLFEVSREAAQGVELDRIGNNDWTPTGLWELLRTTLADNREFETIEVERDFAAIGRRTLLLDARRISQQGNLAHLVLVVFQDISERKQAEEALREADRRKDEFLATLSHELRNPLAPLRNMLEIMKRAGTRRDLLERARDTMDRQLGHMTRLVDDLLDVSRITRGKIELRKERLELSSLLNQVVEACRPLADHHEHQIAVTLPVEPIHLHADPVRLAQLFGNLINNACKYTEPGGKISLYAELLTEDGSPSGEVLVKVKDTGIGIAADDLCSIFEMFTQVEHTLERAQGGLGIGLTLVKQLAELHGGSVQACSEGAGRGSEFIVRLPALIDTSRSAAVR